MEKFLHLFKHIWYIDGWPWQKKYRNVLREGRVRYCKYCHKLQKYEEGKWKDAQILNIIQVQDRTA